jgi:hypothetical protein
MIFRTARLEKESPSVLSTDLGRKVLGKLRTWVPDWGASGVMIYEAQAALIDLYDCSPQDIVADCNSIRGRAHQRYLYPVPTKPSTCALGPCATQVRLHARYYNSCGRRQVGWRCCRNMTQYIDKVV